MIDVIYSNDVYIFSELRIHAIKEILRILRVDGEALIYVWAFEQTEKSFSEQDVFVPWNL